MRHFVESKFVMIYCIRAKSLRHLCTRTCQQRGLLFFNALFFLLRFSSLAYTSEDTNSTVFFTFHIQNVSARWVQMRWTITLAGCFPDDSCFSVSVYLVKSPDGLWEISYYFELMFLYGHIFADFRPKQNCNITEDGKNWSYSPFWKSINLLTVFADSHINVLWVVIF